jgi:choline kinase
MQCVILAAGLGSRIKDLAEIKPLLKINKVAFLEKIILSAVKVGISDFFVVTGFNHLAIDKFVKKISTPQKIKITTIYNKHWEIKANGYSALQAKNHVEGVFFLLMADHMFDNTILQDMKNHYNQFECNILLGIDNNIKDYDGDIHDATKVLIKNNFISNIGKNIKEYSAIDTGIFLCDDLLFKSLEFCDSKNKTTLTDAILHLSHNSFVRGFDVDSRFWVDIDTREDYNKAKSKLKE